MKEHSTEPVEGAGKTETPAYFTVEAALIIPLVLCIFVIILYLAFYLYDRCILAQDCYVLSYRQSIEKGGADRAGSQEARARLGQKLFMLSGMQTGYAGGGTISVSGNASMDPPVFLPEFGDLQNRWILGVKEKARKTDPPRAYRRVRRILNLAST